MLFFTIKHLDFTSKNLNLTGRKKVPYFTFKKTRAKMMI